MFDGFKYRLFFAIFDQDAIIVIIILSIGRLDPIVKEILW
jgi:hypothetical protein